MAQDDLDDRARTGSSRAAAWTLLVTGGVVLLVLVGVAAVVLLTGDDETVAAPPGLAAELENRVPPTQQAPLPDVPLEPFGDRAPIDLDGYRGAPLIVNFWASWCPPCIEEMPDFDVVARELDGRVPLLGVNVQDAPANAQAFVEELGVTYDLAADPRAELYAAISAFGMPTTLFVDEGGTIVYRHTGPLDAQGLRDLVAEHLGVEA